jgi:uncharacterized repeat protein (TIGR01451 family)
MKARFSVARSRGARIVVSVVAVMASSLIGLVVTAPSAAAAAQTCGFADPGSGTFADTLCWFDMSGYDATQAASAGGQQLTINLPAGYTIRFTLNVTGGAVAPSILPTWPGGFLGNRGYTGVPGDPALYQTTSGTTTTATMTNIVMTDSGGHTVNGYSLVGADAESTDAGESITWTSSVPITSLTASPAGTGLGNACGGGFTGVGTNTVTCTGTSVGNKTGTAILASEAPSTFTQSMHGSGLEGFAFGVLVSRVELNKTVVNGFNTDNFTVSAANSSNVVLGTGSTGPGGTSASTGAITVLVASAGEQFTLAESATSGTLADYTDSWNCTRNGAADATLPSGAAGATATVDLAVGDSVTCTITNTGDAASLSLTKHAATPVDVNHDGLVDAGDTIAYTFTVHNTGDLEIDGIGVTDDTAGAVTCPQADLAAGDTEVCAADTPYVITAADVTAGSVQNTATAGGTVFGSAATVASPPSSTTTTTTAPAPSLSLSKSVLPTSVTNAGQTVSYSYLVTNTGNVTISGVTVDELTFGGTGTPPVVSCPIGAASLVPSASVTCTASYTVTQADIDAGSVSNSADATGTDPASNTVTSATSTATFSTVSNPGLTLVKSASPSGALNAGDVITYSFVVTNTGNMTLTNITVDEGAFSGTGTMSAVTCPSGAASLAPGDQVTCTATYAVTQADVDAGTLSNSATATGTPPAGTNGPITSPPSTVDLPETPLPALSIVKSAAPTTLSKVGQTITYSFLITNTGNVTITDAAVTDTAFTGSGSLSGVSCPPGADLLVPAAQVTCTAIYHVTQQDLDASSISNTAIASGKDPSDVVITSPPSTAKVTSTAPSKLGLVKTAHAVDVNHDNVIDAGDRIDWTLVVTNLGATTITHLTVSDPTAGTVSCPDTSLAPGAHMTCVVASHTITAADAKAGHVRNTATATGTVMKTVFISSSSASAVVVVHARPKPKPGGGRGPNPRLPFTGFAMTLPLAAGGIALVLLGALMLFAGTRRRRASDC